MLSNIRKIADSLIIRLLLVMIAFAFVGWGIKDVIQSRNNLDIATFSTAKNITENDFLKAKSEEISIIQRQSDTNLTEEEINQLGLDQIVLQRLINERILNHIVGYYHLDINDDTVIQFVKQSPVFKNEQGKFDLKIFKSAFKNSYQGEAEYLKNIKEKMLKSILISTFLEAFKTPEIMVQNIIDYMSETRTADIIQLELKSTKHINLPSPTTEQLKDFYDNNQPLFSVPEMRSFAFVKISEQYLQNKITITNSDLQNFYEENTSEFKDSFPKVKKQVTELLKRQKIDELLIEFSKNLEDEVASGLSLKEIAAKYELPLQQINNTTYSSIVKDNPELQVATSNIFEMMEGEVSYPIELKDKTGLMLVELLSIKQAKIEELANVTDKAIKLWQQQQLELQNIKTIEVIAKDYTSPAVNLKELNSLGIVINQKFSIARIDLEKEQKLPLELLIAIFQTKTASTTPIFKQNGTAYFAYIKSIKNDSTKAETIKKTSGKHISTTIKNGVMEELINHFIKKNKMKINFPDTLPKTSIEE